TARSGPQSSHSALRSRGTLLLLLDQKRTHHCDATIAVAPGAIGERTVEGALLGLRAERDPDISSGADSNCIPRIGRRTGETVLDLVAGLGCHADQCLRPIETDRLRQT